MTHPFQIAKNPAECLKHLDAITQATDANRATLGFNPAGAYEDSIRRGKLWVAQSNTGEYLGHLMFGGRASQETRIFQIYVVEHARRSGVANTLLQEISLHAENLSCISLRADVRHDLIAAVQFWQKQGFVALKLRDKKNQSGRSVYIFYKRLNTPSLLDAKTPSLQIQSKMRPLVSPTYVIDLNILLTLLKNRPNAPLIGDILRGSMAGEFNIYITPEFETELKRHPRANDPLLTFVQTSLPVLPPGDAEHIPALIESLRDIVFPTRDKNRKKSSNDRSDLRHLAYCITNSVTGFITQENAILEASSQLHARYGVDVLSPRNFAVEHFEQTDAPTTDIPIAGVGGKLSLSKYQRLSEVNGLTSALPDSLTAIIHSLLKPPSRGLFQGTLVTSGADICGLYIARTKGKQHKQLDGYFIAHEMQLLDRANVFQHILETFLRTAQKLSAESITFHLQPEALDLEAICIGRGFDRLSSTAHAELCAFAKVPSPLLITPANWKQFSATFKKHTTIDLPLLMPTAKTTALNSLEIQGAKNGQPCAFSLKDIETFLSPSQILYRERKGTLIPIRPAFSADLLERPDTLLPFPITEVALLRFEKAYFRKPTQTKLFHVGHPILFYESQSNRGLIGSARITSSEVMSAENARKLHRQSGVLDGKELSEYTDKSGNVHVIKFDNFVPFPQPVSLRRLHDLGCAKANMVGPESLTYPSLYKIMHEGLGVSSRDVLLSIQPSYVSKIISGKKTVELRKKPFPSNHGMWTWIYASSPSSAIEAVCRITQAHKGSPSEIWDRFSHRCGIAKNDFDAYFLGCEEAHALELTDVHKLPDRMRLDDIRRISSGFSPPQFYRYIDHLTDLSDELLDKLPIDFH